VEAEAWWATLEEHASKSKNFRVTIQLWKKALQPFPILNGNDMHLPEIYGQTRICFSSVVL